MSTVSEEWFKDGEDATNTTKEILKMLLNVYQTNFWWHLSVYGIIDFRLVQKLYAAVYCQQSPT